MSLVHTNLTQHLTQKALNGQPVVHQDLLNICEIITTNADQLVKAQLRIAALEKNCK